MRVKALLAVAALMAATASSAGIYWATNKSAYAVSQRAATPADISVAGACLQNENPRSCVEDLGDVAIDSGNIGVYIDQIRYLTQKNPTLLAACHQMLHDLGEGLAYRVGAEAVFDLPYYDCTFAVYHGAIWALTRDMSFNELQSDITRICQPFFDRAGIENDASRECVHGIGHLLWLKAEGNDLGRAMEACASSGDTRLIEPCVIGANMEMEIAITGGERWVRDKWDFEMFERVFGSSEPEAVLDRYRDICANASEREMRTGCISGYMLVSYTLNNRDTTKVFSVCDTLPAGPEQEQCRSYTGAVVIENSVTAERRGWDPVLMAKMCESYPTSALACAEMVMSQIYRISQPLGDEFCSSLTPTYQTACERGRARAREYVDGLAKGVGA